MSEEETSGEWVVLLEQDSGSPVELVWTERNNFRGYVL